LLEITDLQLDGAQFPRLARSFCESIAETTRETVNINALSGLSCVCIDKVRGNEGMQLDWRIGSRGPLHCGGSAKSMLAFMRQADKERVLEGPLAAYTPKTITDAEVLRAELATIRRRGYAVDAQEIVTGIFCVGVPIFDRLGWPVGAISVSGPSRKAPGTGLQPIVDLLTVACGNVSRRLGYTGTAGRLEVAAKAPRRQAAG
jgi:DNA-binding IclR family transcriptional regulator